jgi:uncharacterized protein HemX
VLVFNVSQETAVAVIAAAGIVVGFLALGIVGWIFLRAAKRDREAEQAAAEAKLAPGSPSAQSSTVQSSTAQSSNGKESS